MGLSATCLDSDFSQCLLSIKATGIPAVDKEVGPMGIFIPKVTVPSKAVLFCYIPSHFFPLPITSIVAGRAIL